MIEPTLRPAEIRQHVRTVLSPNNPSKEHPQSSTDADHINGQRPPNIMKGMIRFTSGLNKKIYETLDGYFPKMHMHNHGGRNWNSIFKPTTAGEAFAAIGVFIVTIFVVTFPFSFIGYSVYALGLFVIARKSFKKKGDIIKWISSSALHTTHEINQFVIVKIVNAAVDVFIQSVKHSMTNS